MSRNQRYPTDLTDRQWNLIKDLVPAIKPGGRPELRPRREIVNAMLYVTRAGCAWRMLPKDLPPWQTA
jgi:putative transposase